MRWRLQEWRQATVSKYAATSHTIPPTRGYVDGRTKAGDAEVLCGTTTLAGWPDAGYGDHASEGKCRVDYVIGLAPSALQSPRHLLRWKSTFTKKLVTSSLGGEACAFTSMVDRMALLCEFFAPFVNLSPGMEGMEDYESLSPRLRRKKTIAGRRLVRHFLGMRILCVG